MGKFYELFNMDAVIAVNELGIIYMRVSFIVGGLIEIKLWRNDWFIFW